MKYYTKQEAGKIATLKNEYYLIASTLPFRQGLYNLVRMYFGLEPKLYYFRSFKSDVKVIGHISKKGDYIPLKREDSSIDNKVNDFKINGGFI